MKRLVLRPDLRRGASRRLLSVGVSFGLAFGLLIVAVPATNAAVTCPTMDSSGIVSPSPSPGVDWSGCDLSGANLYEADLHEADLSGANLAGANLYSAGLGFANLTGANLAGAYLREAYLRYATLTGADLSGADLTGLWHDYLLGVRSGGIQGTPSALHSDWRVVNGYLVGPFADLSGANLAGANLAGANLGFANLIGADLAGADLAGADLDTSDLSGANLTAANLTGARFLGTNLTGANLTDAVLTTGAPLCYLNGFTPYALPNGWSFVDSCLIPPMGGGTLPQQSVPPGGGTFTTDPGNVGPTTDVPVQTEVTVPVTQSGGTIQVSPSVFTTSPPTDYTFFGAQISITSTVTGTPIAPLVLTFTIEGTLGDPATLNVVRTEGGTTVTLPLCTGAIGEASPDPCMTTPVRVGPDANDDIRVTVYTTHASDWNFSIHAPYTVSGFSAPVDNRPVLNSAKGGSAIPVKFSLGGDQGLNVFARSSPASGVIGCGTNTTIDAIEQTTSASTSGLTYDTKSGQYIYTWKTQKAWAGTCRQLELKFNDGSVLRANFKFN